MSAVVKLSSKLPGDEEVNGLDVLASQLVDNPDQVICAITWFVPTKITRDVESGAEVPTLEVRRVEPIGAVDATPRDVVDLAARLYEARTGKNPLPFDQVVPDSQTIDVQIVGDEPDGQDAR